MSHCVVLTPGLSDDPIGASILAHCGSTVYVVPFGWKQPKAMFGKMLRAYTRAVKNLSAGYDVVWLVGESAGGSAVINVWYDLGCPDHMEPVTVCSRLREGDGMLSRLSWMFYSKRNPLFISSVRRCEDVVGRMSPAVALRITTYSGRWDGVVPAETSYLSGANNIQVESRSHRSNIRQAVARLGATIV